MAHDLWHQGVDQQPLEASNRPRASSGFLTDKRFCSDACRTTDRTRSGVAFFDNLPTLCMFPAVTRRHLPGPRDGSILVLWVDHIKRTIQTGQQLDALFRDVQLQRAVTLRTHPRFGEALKHK
jgi:hypothetical protein